MKLKKPTLMKVDAKEMKLVENRRRCYATHLDLSLAPK